MKRVRRPARPLPIVVPRHVEIVERCDCGGCSDCRERRAFAQRRRFVRHANLTARRP